MGISKGLPNTIVGEFSTALVCHHIVHFRDQPIAPNSPEQTLLSTSTKKNLISSHPTKLTQNGITFLSVWALLIKTRTNDTTVAVTFGPWHIEVKARKPLVTLLGKTATNNAAGSTAVRLIRRCLPWAAGQQNGALGSSSALWELKSFTAQALTPHLSFLSPLLRLSSPPRSASLSLSSLSPFLSSLLPSLSFLPLSSLLLSSPPSIFSFHFFPRPLLPCPPPSHTPSLPPRTGPGTWNPLLAVLLIYHAVEAV